MSAQMSSGLLTGKTIVVTRSREQTSSLSSALRRHGATVIEIPAIKILPPRSYEPLDQALRELGSYDWLIVTSANTARVLGERLAAMELAVGPQPRTVAVGLATARALREAGLRVDLVPEPAVAESIVEALREQVSGRRILLVRAEVARALLPSALEQAGAIVTVIDAYRTVVALESLGLVQQTFRSRRSLNFSQPESGKIAALTFTSSSTVTSLLALLREAGCAWPTDAAVFSIGPVTSATLREHGVQPDLEAAQHDVEGLVQCVLRGLAPQCG